MCMWGASVCMLILAIEFLGGGTPSIRQTVKWFTAEGYVAALCIGGFRNMTVR